MATNSALVVRQPTRPTIAFSKRRGARGKPRVSGRQLGMGAAGAVASAAVVAGLVNWFGVRPQWAGVASGSIGAVGAVLMDGPNVRPFAVGAAFGGGAVALATAITHLEAKKPPPKPDPKELAAKADVVASAPGDAKNANATAPGAGFRSAPSLSDEMQAQIRRAMDRTNYRAGG